MDNPNQDFDAFRAAWEANADAVFESGLSYLVSLDGLPCPDGILLSFISRLEGVGSDLPRHAAALISLLNKENPHLQEAGARIACSLITRRAGWNSDASLPEDFEAALLGRLLAPDLDPWVAESVLDFFEAAFRASVRLREPAWHETLTQFFDQSERRRARVRENPAPAFVSGRIMRNRGIHPDKRAQRLLADWRPPG